MSQAKDWVKRIDLPNARLVERTKSKADVLIQRDRDLVISDVIWITDPKNFRNETSARMINDLPGKE